MFWREKILLKLHKLIGSNGLGGFLITLSDGRCACVDTVNRTVIVEVLLDSFYKWDGFDNSVSIQDEKNVLYVLNNPIKIEYGPQSREYLENVDVRTFFDNLKKDVGYTY